MSAIIQTMQLILFTRNRFFTAFKQVRYSSYRNSGVFDAEKHLKTKYEEITTPQLWEYVNRTLAPLIVPAVANTENINNPSGFVPQSDDCNLFKSKPYFVCRNRNHMLPLYLNRSYRGQRRITHLGKIQGNIWQLHDDLKEFIRKESDVLIMPASRINELAGTLEVRGDFYNIIKKWLLLNKF